MSKYCYGRISKSNKYYVRLKEWKGAYDEMGDLFSFCRVLKIFDNTEKCRKYIDWLKEKDEPKMVRMYDSRTIERIREVC